MKIKVTSLKQTKNLAQNFASTLDKNGLFVTLTGDIGAGKTQFVRFVLEYLKVDEKITSPSFVILNEYKSALCPIYHFDLYRLEEKGLNFFEAQVEMVPQNKITLSDEDLVKFNKLVSALEDLDDVQNVYHNVDLPEEDEEE